MKIIKVELSWYFSEPVRGFPASRPLVDSGHRAGSAADGGRIDIAATMRGSVTASTARRDDGYYIVAHEGYCMVSETPPESIRSRVAAALDGDDWTLDGGSTAALRVRLPDRTLVVERRDGPEGARHWSLALRADGATVSKYGPFESAEALTERVATLQDAEIGYTVCCDG